MLNKFIHSSCCCIAILFQLQLGHSQNLSYNIFRGDSKIGTIEAQKNTSGTYEHYNVVGDVAFRVVFKYNRQTHLNVTYKNNELVTGKSKTVMNEDLKELSEIKQKENHYSCFKHPDEKFKIHSSIPFSTVKLYFIEPIGIDKIFSESYLTYCKLEKVGEHKYKLSLPGNKTNYYTYKNEKLVHVLIDRSWFDLTFKINE